jgi:hypothetical protein
MKRFFWILGISAAILVIAVVIILGFYLGSIVKIGVEDLGPRATKVSVKVDTVDVSLLTGSASIKGLVVGNPQGYATPQAISVGTIAIKMDPGSMMSDKIVVHSVDIESPEITFEGGLGKNNLSQILDNMNSNGPAATAAASTGSKPASTVEVDDLLITGTKVHVHLSSLISKDILIPDIHLTNLGNGGKGLTPVELTTVILKAIITNTLKSLSSLGSDVKDLGQGAMKTLGGSLNKLTNGLGGLL